MSDAYAAADYAYSGTSDYGGGYLAYYYAGPHSLDLGGQLSGPGSSAYERLHTIGGTYIDSSTGLYQTDRAYEGQNGSVYQHATNAIDGQPHFGGGPGGVTGIYTTTTSYHLSDGSSAIDDLRTTAYAKGSNGGLPGGPIDHSYATKGSLSDHEGAAYTRNTYSSYATYYASGAVGRTVFDTYSQSYDGHTVPGSVFAAGYTSYTDTAGTTTTRDIGLPPSMG